MLFVPAFDSVPDSHFGVSKNSALERLNFLALKFEREILSRNFLFAKKTLKSQLLPEVGLLVKNMPKEGTETDNLTSVTALK